MIFFVAFSSAFVSNLQYILLAYCLNGTYSTVWGNRPIRSSAVNASKDKFIGKVCRELNDTPSPSGQGCAFPSKVDALMPASRRQYLLLSSVKHRHMKIWENFMFPVTLHLDPLFIKLIYFQKFYRKEFLIFPIF